MNILFDAHAVEDLENIHFLISNDGPQTADAVIERIFASIERLAALPGMGREGAMQGSREWVVPRLPFIVVYAFPIEREELRIAGIFHGATQF